jgi:ankyrin repeat protein
MNPHLKRRTILFAIAILLVALPCFWVRHQYHQIKLDRALIAAVRAGEAERVVSLLAAGANPSARDTPETKQSVIQILQSLFHRTPINRGTPALMCALEPLYIYNPGKVHPANPHIIYALIKIGTDVNAKDALRKTGLIDAAIVGDSESVKALTSAHADVNARDDNGFTALMWAVLSANLTGNRDSVKILIAARSDVNARDDRGKSILQWAIGPDLKAILRKAGATE